MVSYLTVLQLNCHKSTAVMHSLLNDRSLADEVHILCLQEPFARFISTLSHHNWIPYGDTGPTGSQPTQPTPRDTQWPPYPRVLTYVNRKLLQATIHTVGPSHPDCLTIGVRVDCEHGDGYTLHIHNVYNPPRSADTMPALVSNIELANTSSGPRHLVVGDFNAHHPWWQSGLETTTQSDDRVAAALTAADLHLLTPADTVTFLTQSGNELTLDLSLADSATADSLLVCETRPEWTSSSDHEAVMTRLMIGYTMAEPVRRLNMKLCDDDKLIEVISTSWRSRWETLPPLQSAPSEWATALTKATQEALLASTPRKRPSPHSKPWFTAQLGQMRSAVNRLRRIWQQTRDDRSREAYTRIRNSFRSAVRRAKQESTREALASPNDQLWRLARASSRQSRATMIAPIQSGRGHTTDNPEEKATVFQRKFFPLRPTQTCVATPGQERFGWTPFTPDEVSRRIQRSKKDTAPGPDGIPWSAHRKLDQFWDGYSTLLADIFNACVELGIHPEVYKTAETIVLRKPNKADYSQAGSYRPITLLPTTGKLLEALVASRVLAEAESSPGVLPNQHLGGRPYRSAEDATLLIQHFIRDNLAVKRHVALLTADVSGAYNDVDSTTLDHDMADRGWPLPIRAWALSFMAGRTTRLRLGDYTGPEFDSSTGLPQGSPVSQLLWLCYSGGLVEAESDLQRRRHQLSIGWVDDWTYLASSATAEGLAEIVDDITHRAEHWRDTHGASFDPGKTSVMLFHRQGAQSPALPTVSIGAMQVQVVDSTRILGVTFQSNCKFHEHSTHLASKALRAAGALLNWGRRTWGFSFVHSRQLYQSGVLPILEYAAATWFPARSELAKGRSTHIKRLERAQRAAAIMISGGFRTTSTNALQHEAALLPISEVLDYAQARQFIRLRQAPQSHPLRKITNSACNLTHRKRYPAPLHSIAKTAPLLATPQIDIRPPPWHPTWTPPWVYIPNSKESAEALHQELRKDIHDCQEIYTDGSKTGTAVGAAAVWPVSGGWRVAKRSLRKDANIAQAEMTGILLALLMIRESAVPPTTVVIWCDSQAALHAITAHQPKDQRTRQVQEEYTSLREQSWHIYLRWLPGHCGIAGNEKADEAAKDASHKEPHASEPARGTPPSALLAITRREAESRRILAFGEGKGAGLHSILHKACDFRRVVKTHRPLRRAQSSLLTQLRTDHIGLNSYLRRMRLSESGSCPCGHHTDTRTHMLLSCPITKPERLSLQKRFPTIARSVRAMLTSTDPAVNKLVLKIASKRLRHYRLDSPPPPPPPHPVVSPQ